MYAYLWVCVCVSFWSQVHSCSQAGAQIPRALEDGRVDPAGTWASEEKKKKKQIAFNVRKCRANKTCKQNRKKSVGEERHAGFYRQSKHTRASTQTFTLNTAQRTIY